MTKIKVHHAVIHPNELVEELKQGQGKVSRWNDNLIDWVTNHVLASQIMFDVAFFVPLLFWNAPDSVKLLLALLSGNWIQWWALPALQRSQNKTQIRQDAKAEVDHRALTHIAHMQDQQAELLKELSQK